MELTVIEAIFVCCFLFGFWSIMLALLNYECDIKNAFVDSGIVVSKRAKRCIFGQMRYFVTAECEGFARGTYRTIRKKFEVTREIYLDLAVGERVGLLDRDHIC